MSQIVRWESYRNPKAVNGECTLEEFERWSNHPLAKGKFRIVETKEVEEPPEAKEVSSKKKSKEKKEEEAEESN